MDVRASIDRILGWCLSVIMGVMVVNVLWQVFSRYILGSPSTFTDELARYLLIWLGVLGAAYVSGRNMHVAIDVLPSPADSKVRKRIAYFVNGLIVIFAFGAFVVGGFRLVYITYVLDQLSPALQVPLALVYLVIPLSGLLIVYYKIYDIVNR